MLSPFWRDFNNYTEPDLCDLDWHRAYAAGGTAGSELAFTLMMEAGGPTAPLVNAMLEPALIPATEDLAQKIVSHLEKQHGLG